MRLSVILVLLLSGCELDPCGNNYPLLEEYVKYQYSNDVQKDYAFFRIFHGSYDSETYRVICRALKSNDEVPSSGYDDLVKLLSRSPGVQSCVPKDGVVSESDYVKCFLMKYELLKNANRNKLRSLISDEVK